MNHIKLFEEYSNYYKKIGSDYDSIGIAIDQYTEISDDIFNRIKVKLAEKKFNVSKVPILYPLPRRNSTGSGRLLHPVDIIIVMNRKKEESNFISSRIKMTSDEWFYVQLDFGTLQDNGSNKWRYINLREADLCGIYKCDQLEGLFKLFDELEQFS